MPVYGDGLGGEYHYANTPNATKTCTTLPDERSDCTITNYECDAQSFNMTTRKSVCLHYLPISNREICSILPDGRSGCVGLDINATIPPIVISPTHPKPMNMSNSTVQGTPTPVFQNTIILENNRTIQNQIMMNHDHFSPDSIEVIPGSTITWTNNDTMSHRILSGMPNGDYLTYDGIIDSGPLAPGQSFQIVENDVGTIKFYSPLRGLISGSVSNPVLRDSMSGTVIISKTPVLVQQNSISIVTSLLQNTTALNQTYSGPSWVKKIFKWYDDGKLSENELFSFVKYMIDNNVMRDNSLK